MEQFLPGIFRCLLVIRKGDSGGKMDAAPLCCDSTIRRVCSCREGSVMQGFIRARNEDVEYESAVE